LGGAIPSTSGKVFHDGGRRLEAGTKEEGPAVVELVEITKVTVAEAHIEKESMALGGGQGSLARASYPSVGKKA